MATIGALVAELSLESASFHRDMGKAIATLNSSAARMNKTFAGIKSVSGDLFRLLGAGFTAAGIVSFGKTLLDAGEELVKMSQKTGIAVEKLSAYSYAAKLADASTQDVNTALKRLAVSMQESVINQGGEAAKMFRALGISAVDASGKLKTTDAVFEELSATFAGAADGPEKVAVAIKLLGRSGEALIPMMNNLKASMDEAKRSGNIIPESFALRAQEFNDTIKKITISLQSFVANNQASLSFLDTIQFLIKGATHVAIGFAAGLQEMGMQLGAYAAATKAFVTGNFSEAREIIKLYRQDYEAVNAQMEKAQAKLWAELPKEVKKGVDAASQELPRLKLNFDTQFQQLLDGWRNTTKQMDTASVGWANRAADALTNFVMTGKLEFKDFARSIIADLVRIRIQMQLARIFSFFGGGGGSGTGSGTSGGVGGPPAFAHGGAFTVAGSGGTDSQLVSFRATPGERVQVSTPDQQASGGITVINNNNFSLGVKETVRAEIMGLMPQITEQTKAGVQTAIERGGSMSRSVGRRK